MVESGVKHHKPLYKQKLNNEYRDYHKYVMSIEKTKSCFVFVFCLYMYVLFM